MELTVSFQALLQHFLPVFTAPTFVTFTEIVTGWVLSHRHHYVTEIIFAGGNVAAAGGVREERRIAGRDVVVAPGVLEKRGPGSRVRRHYWLASRRIST